MVIAARDANTLIATLTPTPGYYLYRDRISFSVVGPTGVSVASVALPQGKPKADPNFGTVQVYYHPIEALIALRHDGDAPPEVQLLASYQGCNEPLGVCYPPVEKTVTVAFSPIHFGQRGQRSD